MRKKLTYFENADASQNFSRTKSLVEQNFIRTKFLVGHILLTLPKICPTNVRLSFAR